MKKYLVGGAVRDILMGREPKDRDWVVVGATPQEMLDAGYRQVGADFPVFLHPETNEEYALARKERKVAAGYHGFETDFGPEVTLEEDLSRRDLTINAMAMDEDGNIIDPFDGRHDLEWKTLRHVSDAFSEDPLRVLRVARFAARYGFYLDVDTMDLMTNIALSGELEALSKERIWKETERALMEPNWHAYIRILEDCGAKYCIPFIEELDDMIYGDFTDEHDIKFRIAAMGARLTDDMFVEAKIPNDIKELTAVVNEIHDFIMSGLNAPESYLKMFHKVDIFRRYERFQEALSVLPYRHTHVEEDLLKAVEAVLAVDVKSIVDNTPNKAHIRGNIETARILALGLFT